MGCPIVSTYAGLIHDGILQTLAIERARALNSAVALAGVGHASHRAVLQYRRVMRRYYIFHVGCAAVAKLEGVAVEQFSQGVFRRETLFG
jgi:hypothetical protein